METKPATQVLVAGWTCFGVAIAAMLLSLAWLPVYAPLMLAAFVLSIVAITKSRLLPGIALLAAVVLIGPAVWIGSFAVGWEEATQQVEIRQQQKEHAKRQEELARQSALNALKFEDVEGYVERDYWHLEGRLRNTGTRKVDYERCKSSGSMRQAACWIRTGRMPSAPKAFRQVAPRRSKS